jgi:hypothetical protein
MSDLLARLRNRRDWDVALREAEMSGDLAPLARLFDSGAPLEQATSRLFVKLFDRRRLIRKPGRQPTPLFGPSAQDRYEGAVRAVKRMRKVMKVWEDVRKKDPMFVNRVRDELGALVDPAEDPVDFVAKGLGLNADKLANVVQGKTGFGRKAKPKPKPGSADK